MRSRTDSALQRMRLGQFLVTDLHMLHTQVCNRVGLGHSHKTSWHLSSLRQITWGSVCQAQLLDAYLAKLIIKHLGGPVNNTDSGSVALSMLSTVQLHEAWSCDGNRIQTCSQLRFLHPVCSCRLGSNWSTQSGWCTYHKSSRLAEACLGSPTE